MFNWIRTHNRKLMLIVAVLTIISFGVFYNATDIEGLGKDRVAKIYGRSLSETDLRREVRAYELAMALGLTNLVRTLGGSSETQGIDDFIFNLMVLRHETQQLGLVPSDQQVKDAISKLAAFQTDGQFDPMKYSAFLAEQLTPRGFNERQLEEVVRDSLRLDMIEQVIGAAPTASAVEVDFAYRTFQPVTGYAVRFEISTYLDQAVPTEEQLAADFERKKPRLNTEEIRSVRYVAFTLAPEQAALEGRERTNALQALADRSSEFADAAAASSLEKAAADAGLKVESSPEFNADGVPKQLSGLTIPPEAVSGPLRAIAPAAFMLSTSDPVSGVIQDGDNFYVAELVTEIPSRPMTFEEARELLTQESKVEQASAALTAAADKVLGEIRQQLKDGKPFAEAATAAGVQSIPVDNIAPSSETGTPEQRNYADAMTLLEPGQLSGLQVGQTGAFAVYLEKRDRDEKDYAERKAYITDFIRERKSSILLIEWLESARQNSGLEILGQG